ncbi:hypothetical protein ACS0TY_029932 [Phlomoides rotata]
MGFWKPENRQMIECLSVDEVRLYLKNFVSSKFSDSKPDCAFSSMMYGGSMGGLCSLIKFISEILTTPEDSATNVLLEDAQRNHIYSENGLV